VFPAAGEEPHPHLFEEVIMIGLPLVGIALAWFIFGKRAVDTQKLAGSGFGAALHRFWFTQWGMDWLYGKVFVQPYNALARMSRNDFIDSFYNGTASVARHLHGLVSETQTGQVRWYAVSLGAGLLLLVSIGVFL